MLATHRRVLGTTTNALLKALQCRIDFATRTLLQPTNKVHSTFIPLHLTRQGPSLACKAFSSSPSSLERQRASQPVQSSDPHSSVLDDGTALVRAPAFVDNDLDKVLGNMMRNHLQRTPHPPAKDYVTLSFYQFRPIAETDLLKIQYYFLTDLRAMDVVGRIYISSEGINAQISCPKDRVNSFKSYYAKNWPIFDKIRFNPAMSEGKAFKKLHVRIKGQLVADGISNDTFDLYNEPTYLTPEEWHKELSSLPKPPVLIDMRNHYESTIGHFENAVRPDVTTFKENVDAMFEICEGKEEEDIYMYCTGGIRCTRSGALLKSKGFKSVKMLQGGVTAYGRFIQDQKAVADKAAVEASAEAEAVKSIYKGKNFTFDKRLGEPITDEVLAKCHICGTNCDTYCNCKNTACNILMIACPACQETHSGTCGSGSCVDMVKELQKKQKYIDETYPQLVGMKARPGVAPLHNYRLRVRPDLVIEQRKNKEASPL